MGRLRSTRFAFWIFILVAVMEATNPAFAQNINGLLTMFGGDRQRALRHAALVEWRRLPPAEIACMDQGLRQNGSSADDLVRRGVKPSAAGLAELRSSCHRQLAQGIPTNAASRVTEASQAGLPATDRPASSATEPKDAPGTLPSSPESVGRAAENQVQQGNIELKDRFPESGIMQWLSAAFLVAVVSIAALLGIVIYLFIRWRSTGRRAVAASLLGKDSESAVGKAPLETAIGKGGEVVTPLLGKRIRASDQTGRDKAFSMSQNFAYSTALLEPSGSTTPGRSVVDNVAHLAKLYAKGTPSEKEIQRLKELISHSIVDSQEPEFR